MLTIPTWTENIVQVCRHALLKHIGTGAAALQENDCTDLMKLVGMSRTFFLSHSTAIKSKQMCFMKTHVPSKQQGQFFCQRKSGHSHSFFNLCTSKSLKKNLQDQADRIGYGLLQKHGFAPEPLGGWRCWVTELRQQLVASIPIQEAIATNTDEGCSVVQCRHPQNFGQT